LAVAAGHWVKVPLAQFRLSAWYDVVSGEPALPDSGLFRSDWLTRVTTAVGVAVVRDESAVFWSRPPIELRSWVL
jgi:hypothetical protein